MVDDAICTPAWLLVGLTRSIPGVLQLLEGRLIFTIDEDNVFDAPVSEVTDVVFPWYYFSGGVKLKVSDKPYRLSFVRPNNAADIPGRLLARVGGSVGALAALTTTARKFKDMGEGRAAGKAWRAVLKAAVRP